MTLELFLEDSYKREFEARVLRIDGREVVLDRTVFFPGGGGQPADKGTLGIGPVQAHVIDARRDGDEIVHVLDKPIPNTVRNLEGTLDWDRRHAHMRYHTALHVLSAAIGKECDARATGVQIRPNRARLDFALPGDWTAKVVGKIQRLTNEILADSRPVRFKEMSGEEALAELGSVPAREDLEAERVTSFRVVEIEGVDVRLDGGTHVSNTAEVGEVEITDLTDKDPENKRIMFVLR